ncbi:MAG: hypothetical protein WBO29_15600, partial [Albidovulum sp.]
MAVVAQFEFAGKGSGVAGGATGLGVQSGVVLNGASQNEGMLWLGSQSGHATIATPELHPATGTISIEFVPTSQDGTGAGPLLSRSGSGAESSGHFSLGTTAAGQVVAQHDTPSAEHSFGTPAGFFTDGDALSASYSWDASGKGGAFTVTNSATGAVHSQPISAALTMDMEPDGDAPWIIGSPPEQADTGAMTGSFQGTVSGFKISDSVDNCGSDGIVEGTGGDDFIDADYLGDPDGDRIDHGDAVLPGAQPNDDYVLAGDGNDTVYGGLGRDQIFGEDGDDSIFGGDGNDTI